MKSKIAITADIHAHNWTQYARIDEYGYNSRLVEIADTLMWIGTKAHSMGCTSLLILGDLYHSWKAIDISVLHQISRVMYSLVDMFEGGVFILRGNHDTSKSGDMSDSVSMFSGICAVSSVVDVWTVGGIEKIGCIPYTNDSEEVATIMRGFIKKGVRKVVGHLGITGGKVGPSDFELPGNVSLASLCYDKFDWIILGHYHKQQLVAPGVWYVGAPLQHTWGDRNTKPGFFVVSDRDVSVVENTKSPRFVEVTKDLSQVCPQDYVKVISPTESSANGLVDEILLKGVSTDSVSKEVTTEEVYVPKISLAGLSLSDMLSKYCTEVSPLQDELIDGYVDVGVDMLREAGI